MVAISAFRSPRWIAVCPLEEIVSGTGVCALVDGQQMAVFRVGNDVYALSNRDPASGANVLSRGIVGDRAGELKVASPLYKHSYSLATGACLNDPSLRVPTCAARVIDGVVHLQEPGGMQVTG